MSLIAQYLFNNNCNSETGNYNGTPLYPLYEDLPTGYHIGGRAILFDSQPHDQRRQISFPSYNWNSTWSIETWYKRTQAGGVDLFLHAGEPGNNKYLHVGINESNALRLGFWNDDLDAPGTYTDPNWHHLVFTYNSNTLARQIFCDGVRVTNDTASSPLNATSAWYVGWSNNGNFNGGLANLRIWDEALNAETVASHYNAEKAKYPQISFNYTGGEQTYTAPVAGYYKLEVYGAGGGTQLDTFHQGTGGYAVGVVKLKKNDRLYVYVGGQGTANAGGYNGGGGVSSVQSSSMGGGGGGATHIATSSGVLSTKSGSQSDILIVAGGGGGAAVWKSSDTAGAEGGSGGGYVGNPGLKGTNSSSSGDFTVATGGTQSAGGTGARGSEANGDNGSFGQGGTGYRYLGGGGGGFYGGGGGGAGYWTAGSGGGGSGYIANPKLLSYGGITKKMIGYNVATSNENSTRTETLPYYHVILPYNGEAVMSNGFASITVIEPAGHKTAANLLMMM